MFSRASRLIHFCLVKNMANFGQGMANFGRLAVRTSKFEGEGYYSRFINVAVPVKMSYDIRHPDDPPAGVAEVFITQRKTDEPSP